MSFGAVVAASDLADAGLDELEVEAGDGVASCFSVTAQLLFSARCSFNKL